MLRQCVEGTAQGYGTCCTRNIAVCVMLSERSLVKASLTSLLLGAGRVLSGWLQIATTQKATVSIHGWCRNVVYRKLVKYWQWRSLIPRFDKFLVSLLRSKGGNLILFLAWRRGYGFYQYSSNINEGTPEMSFTHCTRLENRTRPSARQPDASTTQPPSSTSTSPEIMKTFWMDTYGFSK